MPGFGQNFLASPRKHRFQVSHVMDRTCVVVFCLENMIIMHRDPIGVYGSMFPARLLLWEQSGAWIGRVSQSLNNLSKSNLGMFFTPFFSQLVKLTKDRHKDQKRTRNAASTLVLTKQDSRSWQDHLFPAIVPTWPCPTQSPDTWY